MDKTILADGEQIYGFVITHRTVSGEILLETIWRDGDTSPVVDEGCFRIALHNKKKK